jgi:uncharacterized protein involved in exopolysaccharide biosynthesis
MSTLQQRHVSETQSNHDQDIDVIDLVGMLWHNKLLVILPIILMTAASFGYLAMATPVYESRAVLRIGVAGERKEPVEQGRDLVARLKVEYDFGQSSLAGPIMSSVTVFETPTFVELIAEGHDPVAVADFLRRAAERVVDEHRQRVDELLQVRVQQIDDLAGHLESLQRQRESLPVRETRDGALAAAISIERANLDANIIALVQVLTDRKLIVNEVKGTPTVIHLQPSASENPSRPRRALILVIGVVLGLTFGVMLAWGREYIRRNAYRFRNA